ncbi:transcription antitermination factor NusB [Ancylobacter sp. 6x-1]|uniref:Transcription antitermination protein NusB n=1 Tax=Ancylobacter crimeensis TaxID=2579147 RepID=A0ABT0D6X9_9HYPH|nr:transcription antitermination factor NusB [Ancylobacter crimeensis]MCK0195700.1 transcription antitermination factor NusB [Ancylobacter crimeensis]
MATEPKPASSKPVNHKPVRKSAARLNAVQALYQMDVAATPLPDILAQFESYWIGREIEGEEIAPADLTLFRDIVSGVLREQRNIDPVLDAALVHGWPLKRVETVLRAVLRAGAYELSARPDVPARVVVAEYVNVAAAFLDREETGMVNAVLDGLAREMRAGEFAG